MTATVDIPAEIADLTPAWLTAALRADPSLSADLTVSDVRAERIAEDTGFSSLLYRLHLTGSEGSPRSLIAKLPGTPEARGAMELLGGYRKELMFYSRVAGTAPMATPHCYVARIADETSDFVLILEDLREWHNADHLAGLPLEQAHTCIDQLAALHAWSVTTADDEVLRQFPPLDTPVARDLLVPVFAPAWQIYREHTTQPIPDRVADYAERFAEFAPQALSALAERNMLLHGDIRADNMFFRGTRLKVVDFQMAVRGAGAADIAYLVSQGLPTDVRRGLDAPLLRRYLNALAQHGVDDYSFDEAWRHYRFAVAYLMVLPVVILIGWDSMPPRSRQLCVTLVDRAVATLTDIEALEVFA
ncbi:hypothetical protein MCHIJ_21260 [Mycolicibacterium chitae]|uniref:Aminoglycoside phosphotransferase n=1 Tax=Mycolicibacterium chitae TaxID=1792 RepID=A0A448HZE1_MYCCI|nr:phosphotransferase [Mycolicibacterium chitae]MCV7107045.1 phosphotransferase [Mycolicibacterium chitae]BBZ02689.1 hypothetical protein MCHIJ_21260 [Mycolicibacterium chitae]VEG45492.1 aminoglycoside phosphotransferase [Mycolicibacterium chitae]